MSAAPSPRTLAAPEDTAAARRWRGEAGPTRAEYLMFGALVALVLVMAVAILSSAISA